MFSFFLYTDSGTNFTTGTFGIAGSVAADHVCTGSRTFRRLRPIFFQISAGGRNFHGSLQVFAALRTVVYRGGTPSDTIHMRGLLSLRLVGLAERHCNDGRGLGAVEGVDWAVA